VKEQEPSVHGLGISRRRLDAGKPFMKRVCVVDGQGGGIGATIIKALKARYGESIEVWALGTNAVATSQMLRAGANRGATGENPVMCTVKEGLKDV
jgi:hypothetical protein